MAPPLLFILQAATVTVPPDLSQTCPEQSDEIVVCHKAIEPDHYRLPLRGDALPADKNGLPRAEWGLGGGVRMGVNAQSAAMPQGAVSKRAMVTIKITF